MSTFDGYFREFDGLIRADNFEDSSRLPIGLRPSLVFLLSHAHSDHLVALDSFHTSTVYCSQITRDMVLNLRPTADRLAELAGAGGPVPQRTYRNLRQPGTDLLKPLPLHTPTPIPVPTPDDDQCLLTLLPANHCPGAVMFLIQMWGRTVLYTADIRAEPWWVDALTKEPLLAPHVVPSRPSFDVNEAPQSPYLPLDNIYLDTSSLLTKRDVLTKEDALRVTMDTMVRYPSTTVFFLNAWTWGYEELLQRVAQTFKAKIHVDPYKYEIFRQPHLAAQYPLLSHCLTLDPSVTRFHACERQWRCSRTWGTGRGCAQFDGAEEPASKVEPGERIVYVNPWEITTPKWIQYDAKLACQLARAEKGEGDWPAFLICPLARHSSFTEIYKFVSIFRPKCLFPNTTSITHGFPELYALPTLFRRVIDRGAPARLASQAARYTAQQEVRLGRMLPRARLSDEEEMETVFERHEKLEFGSERYRNMWDELFQVADEQAKLDALRFVECGVVDEQEEEEVIEIVSSQLSSLDRESVRSKTQSPVPKSVSYPESDHELARSGTPHEPAGTVPSSSAGTVPGSSAGTVSGSSAAGAPDVGAQMCSLSSADKTVQSQTSSTTVDAKKPKTLSAAANQLQKLEYEFLRVAQWLTWALDRSGSKRRRSSGGEVFKSTVSEESSLEIGYREWEKVRRMVVELLRCWKSIGGARESALKLI